MEEPSINGFLEFLEEKRIIDEDSITYARMFVMDYLKSVYSALDETQAVRQNEDAESNFICYHFENGNVSAKCHKPCGDRCCIAV